MEDDAIRILLGLGRAEQDDLDAANLMGVGQSDDEWGQPEDDLFEGGQQGEAADDGDGFSDYDPDSPVAMPDAPVGRDSPVGPATPIGHIHHCDETDGGLQMAASVLYAKDHMHASSGPKA